VFYGWSPLLAVVEGSDKLIFGPDRELYDIKADPFEASDVIESRAERAGALQDRMETLFGSDLDQVAASTSLRLSAEELEKLRALGYTGGAPPTSTTSPPHPRDEMKLMSRVQIAAATGNDGDRAKAIHLLERIISDHPDFTPPYEYLADQYRHQQDYDGAKATLHRYIRIRPADARPLLKLADVHLLTDEIDEAVELQRRALVLNPSHFAATFTLGRLLLEDGQSVEAADLFARALLLHPRDEQLPGMYVDVMLKLGRRDEAESTLRRLIDVDPHLLFVTDALGRLGTAEEVPE
jgi:tetratricopeptide (TPR) repeat protein